MALTRISSDPHPLTARIRALRKHTHELATVHTVNAQALLADHRDHSVSTESVYKITGGILGPDHWSFSYYGAAEDYGHLADQAGFMRVYDGMKPAAVLAELFHEFRDLQELEARAAAAEEIADAVQVALVIRVGNGDLTWDTGETLPQAARRLAYDAAERALGRHIRAWHVWSDMVGPDMLDLPDTPRAAQVGETYLAQQTTINTLLAEQDIDRGVPLTIHDVQAKTGVLESTWRARVTRGTAPGSDLDQPSRWWPQTVTAWQLAQGKTTW